MGILLEYQYDGRNGLEPVTIADDDVFLATRIALNDVQDTTVLAGIVWDTRSDETYLNIEAERRFGQDYLVELRVRAFSSSDPRDPVYAIRNDDYVQLKIERFY